MRANNSSGAQYSRVQLQLKSTDKTRVNTVVDLIKEAVNKQPKADGTVNIAENVSVFQIKSFNYRYFYRLI